MPPASAPAAIPALPAWAGAAALVLAWAILFLPPAGLRDLYYEEGRRALAALDMLEHGRWLVPQVLGVDYVNKPPLLPWAIAGVGRLIGAVDEWAVRLLPLLMTLAGGLLAWRLAGRAGGGLAGLAAGLAFFLTPMVMEKAALGETDVTVTVLTFAAFALWWPAAGRGPVGWGRWAGCAVLLALAALAKGPIPLAFFAVAAAGWSLWHGRWRDLLGLTAALGVALAAVGGWALAAWEPGRADQWQGEMRLAAGAPGLADYLAGRAKALAELVALWLPWLVLAVPALLPALGRRLGIAGSGMSGVLAIYAGLVPVVVMLWPYALPRYVMPAVPALAVAAGLTAAALWPRRRVRRLILGLAGLMALAQLGLGLGVIPVRAELYGYARPAGEALAEAVAADPAPVVFASPISDMNMVYYSGLDVRAIPPSAADRAPAPGWLITTPDYLDAVRQARPALPAEPVRIVHGRRDQPFLLFRTAP